MALALGGDRPRLPFALVLRPRIGQSTARRREMSDVNKQLVRDFLTAFYSGDIDGAHKTCDDDVEFIVNAPVEFFPHFGPRRGKVDVAETSRALPAPYAGLRQGGP